MVLSITYDLKKPGQSYTALYESIKGLGPWWHYLESCWLVDTQFTPQQVVDHLKAHLDTNDYLFVTPVRRPYQGWLPQDAWAWINARVTV